jgi:hypothetical protein
MQTFSKLSKNLVFRFVVPAGKLIMIMLQAALPLFRVMIMKVVMKVTVP